MPESLMIAKIPARNEPHSLPHHCHTGRASVPSYSVNWPRRNVNEDVADGLLLDLRGVDMASLLTETADSSMESALDRILLYGIDIYNDFSSSIG